MKWDQAKFVITKTKPEELPHPHGIFEIALVGRSNAGKSSFLNALTQKKALARTSKTPGKTRHLNLFSIDEKLFLTDLPGYGYAKRSKEEQIDWTAFISDYLERRKPLKLLLLVMDCRRELEDEEECLLALSAGLQLPLFIILNKCDKLSSGELPKILKKFYTSLPIFPVSCKTGRGIDAVRKAIEGSMKHAISS